MAGGKDVDMGSDGGFGQSDEGSDGPRRHGMQPYMGNSSDEGSDNSDGIGPGSIGDLKNEISKQNKARIQVGMRHG